MIDYELVRRLYDFIDNIESGKIVPLEVENKAEHDTTTYDGKVKHRMDTGRRVLSVYYRLND